MYSLDEIFFYVLNCGKNLVKILITIKSIYRLINLETFLALLYYTNLSKEIILFTEGNMSAWM